MRGISDFAPLARLLSALQPWLDDIVIVGGWAHRLYRLHDQAQELDYAPLMTLDTDVAVPGRLPFQKQDIRERMLEHGFHEELLGDDRPPATHYHLKDSGTGFYAEFLTPLIGKSSSRKNERKATTEVAGIISQQLRYVEILLEHPWSVHIQAQGFTGRVQVASPVSFVVQKVLIHKKREREDRAKDILYMHDSLEIFGARLPELHTAWQTVVAPQLHARNVRKVAAAARDLFSEETDDIRRAAQMTMERAMTPHALMEACRYAFERVFEVTP